MNLIGEAFRASLQPCSYTLLILALVLVILRKHQRLTALGVFTLSVVISAWLPMTSFPEVPDTTATGAIILVAGLALVGWLSHPGAGLGGALLLGLFAGSTWIPCVGAELGKVLTLGIENPLQALPQLALYLAGIIFLVAVIALLLNYFPYVRRFANHQWARWAAQLVAVILGIIAVTGRFPDLLSELARRSSL